MKLRLISEGYGRVHSMDGTYLGYRNDPTPKVLSLGKWVSPRNNTLLAGINLHYLDDDQIERLQKNLSGILQDRNLRRRVRKLRALMPDVFDAAYRTYDTKKINGQVTKGTLKFIKPKDLLRQKVKGTGEADDTGEVGDLDKGAARTPNISDRVKQRHKRMHSSPKDREEDELVDKDEVDKDNFEKTVDDVEDNTTRDDEPKDQILDDPKVESEIDDDQDIDDDEGDEDEDEVELEQ